MTAKQFFAGLSLSAVLGGGIAIGGYKLMEPEHQTSAPTAREQALTRLASLSDEPNANVPAGLNFVDAATAVTPTVVHVQTEYTAQPTRGYQNDPMAPFFRDFFGDNYNDMYRGHQGPQAGSGSGVIISSNGYIVTNNHVIDRADKIKVVLDDKRTYEAKLIGTDPTTDLAVLKVDADNLPSIRYGNSDKVRVGEWVLAVGNPFNLTSTVTAGIVSAKARSINILHTKDNMQIESYIQTDAAVNPGNSGGALVNLSGELVGINSAIATQTGSFSGYSFAVPTSIVSKVVEDLMKYGEVQRALLGVQIREVDQELAKEKELKTLNGVFVGSVNKNSAADDAGIKEGDVITQVNGVTVNTPSQLTEQVARYRPGDEIKVTVLRDEKPMTIGAKLKNIMGDTEVVKRSDEAMTVEGAMLSMPSKQEMNKLGLASGVKIDKVRGSKFQEAGVKDDFIITRIDKQDVSSPRDVAKALKDKKGGILIEGVYPDGRKAYYATGW
jgi:serine protease Do